MKCFLHSKRLLLLLEIFVRHSEPSSLIYAMRERHAASLLPRILWIPLLSNRISINRKFRILGFDKRIGDQVARPPGVHRLAVN